MRRRSKLQVFLSVFCFVLLLNQSVLCQQQHGPVIAGYLPDYRNYINIDKPSKFLTDLILFSISPNASGSINDSCCLDRSHYQKAREARKGNGDLNILVSIGGGGRSNSFSQLSSSPKSRGKLIRELIKLW